MIKNISLMLDLAKIKSFRLKSFSITILVLISIVAHSQELKAEAVLSPIHTIKAFTANYSLLHKSRKVGKGVRKLIYHDDGTVEYSYKSDISWLIFSDTRTETSIVNLKNDIVTPLKYTYKREGTGRDKFYQWAYDANKNQATNVKKKQTFAVDFSLPLQDTLSYHLQHRLKMIANPTQKQFVYPVIKNSGKVKNYVYQYDGEEELMLPYGLVKTIRLKRELIEKKRITYAWFAPKLNFLLVKLYQVKGGTEQFEAQLTSLKIEGKQVKNK